MKWLMVVVTSIYSLAALACPYCAGNGQGGKDSNTTLILSLFILSIYLPYIIIYRLIKKSREMHDAQKPGP